MSKESEVMGYKIRVCKLMWFKAQTTLALIMRTKIDCI